MPLCPLKISQVPFYYSLYDAYIYVCFFSLKMQLKGCSAGPPRLFAVQFHSSSVRLESNVGESNTDEFQHSLPTGSTSAEEEY